MTENIRVFEKDNTESAVFIFAYGRNRIIFVKNESQVTKYSTDYAASALTVDACRYVKEVSHSTEAAKELPKLQKHQVFNEVVSSKEAEDFINTLQQKIFRFDDLSESRYFRDNLDEPINDALQAINKSYINVEKPSCCAVS